MVYVPVGFNNDVQVAVPAVSQGGKGSRRGDTSASTAGHASTDAAGNPIQRVNSAASMSSIGSNSSAQRGKYALDLDDIRML
jgi:hypothetical protein